MAKKIEQEVVCQKNDILDIKITDMGNEGEGIGKIEGYTLFVKDALAGDFVRVKVMKTKKHYGYARLLEILEPSTDRVPSACKVARQCGGCQLQHCSYARQLRFKEEKVRNCLERIGGFENITMEPILFMEIPYYYRNKAQFPVGTDQNGNPVAGFYAGRTHQIIENSHCMIQHPCNAVIIDTILDFMKEHHISAYDEENHSGTVRHILTRVGIQTGEVMVCLVVNAKKLKYSEELVQRLLAIDFNQAVQDELQLQEKKIFCGMKEEENHSISHFQEKKNLQIKSICLNRNTDKTNTILGNEVEVLYGQGYIVDAICGIQYQISPLSFYQVNPLQTQKLYETALEYADLQGGEVVWDLYCGIGTISLYLAQKASKVCGVEIVSQAVKDARKNAILNDMKNVEFFVGAAEDVVPEKYAESNGKLRADVVTLDPPRKGCDEKLLETVIQMGPKKIVYVSCDPATLARDAKYLCAHGYQLKKVRVCDMFGMSFHTETVMKLEKVM